MKLNELMKKHLKPEEKRYSIDGLVYSEEDAKEIEKLLSKVLKRVSKVSRLNVIQKL